MLNTQLRGGAERQHQPQEEAVEADTADSWTFSAFVPQFCRDSDLRDVYSTGVCSSVACPKERFVGDIRFVGQIADWLTRQVALASVSVSPFTPGDVVSQEEEWQELTGRAFSGETTINPDKPGKSV